MCHFCLPKKIGQKKPWLLNELFKCSLASIRFIWTDNYAHIVLSSLELFMLNCQAAVFKFYSLMCWSSFYGKKNKEGFIYFFPLSSVLTLFEVFHEAFKSPGAASDFHFRCTVCVSCFNPFSALAAGTGECPRRGEWPQNRWVSPSEGHFPPCRADLAAGSPSVLALGLPALRSAYLHFQEIRAQTALPKLNQPAPASRLLSSHLSVAKGRALAIYVSFEFSVAVRLLYIAFTIKVDLANQYKSVCNGEWLPFDNVQHLMCFKNGIIFNNCFPTLLPFTAIRRNSLKASPRKIWIFP